MTSSGQLTQDLTKTPINKSANDVTHSLRVTTLYNTVKFLSFSPTLLAMLRIPISCKLAASVIKQ